MSVGLQRLRDDAETIRNGAIAKGEDPQLVDQAIAADEERRRLLGDVDGWRAQRKEISAQVGAAMKAGGAGADELKARSTELGARIEAGEERLREIEADLDDLLLRIPQPTGSGRAGRPRRRHDDRPHVGRTAGSRCRAAGSASRTGKSPSNSA